MKIQKYNKAIVAVIGGIILMSLSQFGITENTSVKELIDTIIIGALVYFVPNRK